MYASEKLEKLGTTNYFFCPTFDDHTTTRNSRQTVSYLIFSRQLPVAGCQYLGGVLREIRRAIIINIDDLSCSRGYKCHQNDGNYDPYPLI